MNDLLRISKVLPFFLLLLSWLLPNHVPPFSTAYQDFLVFFAILFFFGFFSISIRMDYRHVIVLLISIIPILQWFAGGIFFWGDAYLASAYLFFFWCSLAFSSGASEQRRKKIVSVFFIFLIIGSVLSVWIAARQWLLMYGSIWIVDMPPNGRPFANIAQPNNLATLLSMGLFGVLYFYEKNKLGRLGSGLLVFLLLFGIALTQSRTPWVALPAMLLYWLFKSRYNFRLTRLGFTGVVVIYAGLVFLLPELSSALLLSTANPYERIQSLERLGLWWQLIHAVLGGPLWGYGWNQVSVAQVYISQAYPVPLMTEHSHNILLDILLWNGPLLGGAIILFLGGWLVRLLWCARTVESLCALMAACAVIIHGMLEFPLEYAFLLLPVGLLLGVAIAEDSAARIVQIPPYFKYAIVCVLAALMLWSWSEYRIVEEDHRLMRFETARIGDIESNQAAPPVKLFTQVREFIRFARTPAVEGMSEEDLDWMRKVAHRYPYPPSLFRYSLALGLNGHIDEAREQLAILRALHGDEHYQEAWQSLVSLKWRYPQLQGITRDRDVSD